MRDFNSSYIPNVLVAGEFKALQRLMLANNLSKSTFHEYQIQRIGKNWYAFYYEDASYLINEKEGS
jgi:hypothetical protein